MTWGSVTHSESNGGVSGSAPTDAPAVLSPGGPATAATGGFPAPGTPFQIRAHVSDGGLQCATRRTGDVLTHMRPCNSADPNQLWVQKGQDQAGYGMVFAQDGRCITTTFSTAGKTYCDRLARTNTKRETWKQNSDGRVVNQATPSSMTHRAVRGSANAGQLYTRSSTGALFDLVPRPRRSALVTPITAG